MLYADLSHAEECPVCRRRWLDLGGVKEPVVESPDSDRHGSEGDEPCEECHGDW